MIISEGLIVIMIYMYAMYMYAGAVLNHSAVES